RLDVAAARVDELDVAGGGRPLGALRLQRHAAPRRQPRRPAVRRPDGDHRARRHDRPRLPLRRQRSVPARHRPADRPHRRRGAAACAVRRAEDGVHRAGAVGRRRCRPREAAADRRRARARRRRQDRERLPRDRERRGPAVPARPVAAGVRDGERRGRDDGRPEDPARVGPAQGQAAPAHHRHPAAGEERPARALPLPCHVGQAGRPPCSRALRRSHPADRPPRSRDDRRPGAPARRPPGPRLPARVPERPCRDPRPL
ncbi:MAG: hypothetical protein AVDCRST_MAG85-3071, partial [uncultured Solirubrobacteraceae bacterium]